MTKKKKKKKKDKRWRGAGKVGVKGRAGKKK